MSLAQKYAKSLDNQWNLRFKTPHPDGDQHYDGVVTHIKRSFIVLRMEFDFEFDGDMILPKRSISGCRDGKCERCYNQILRERGELQKVLPTHWLDSCNTLHDVARELHARKIWPAVETVCSEHNIAEIFIGPVTCLTDDRLWLRSYDAKGEWKKEDDELPFENIFSIHFGTRYVNRFNAYMRKRPLT